MNNKYYLALWIMLLFFSCSGGDYGIVKLDTNGFSTEARIYPATEQSPQAFDIVFLHGKPGNPNRPLNSKFAKRMNALGFKVIAPHMPWSEKHAYHGTRKQALQLIDNAVNLNGNQKVILIGHSMGATIALQYAAAHPSTKLAGLVLVAPAHDPNIAQNLYEATAADAEKACNLAKQGHGLRRAIYADVNMNITSFIEATADYYCSFYNVARFPDSTRIISKIALPTLFISGADDRLTVVYSHQSLFNELAKNPKNRYMKLSGNHKTVVTEHTAEIADWIGGL